MLTVNSVIEWIKEEPNKKCLERILWISPDRKQVVTFLLGEKNAFPKFIEIELIENALENGTAIKRTTHPYIRWKTLDPKTAMEDFKKRDLYWSLIEGIVQDEPDIYIPKLRGPMVREVIEKFNVQKKDVIRYLRRFWNWGMTKNSLLPMNENKGHSGKSREVVLKKERSQSKFEGRDGKRGRRSRIEKSNGLIGMNVTDDMKIIFKLGFGKFYVKERLSLTKAFSKMLGEYFNIGDKEVNGIKVPNLPPIGQRPTFGQFCYWVKQDENLKETLIGRNGMKKFNLNNRAVLGNTEKMADGPGKLYQADATIADVILVSALNRLVKIGKPTVYLVSDTFSRKITGFYAGLEGPNWEGFAMSLVNVFEDKVEYCKGFGIEITHEEWGAFVPEKIIFDRGPEFIGNNSDLLSNNLNIHISNTAPYRGDMKPVAERLFHMLNQQVIHGLPGSTKGRTKERGEKNFVEDACLTLNEFIHILIITINKYNQSHYIDDYPMTKEMIRDEVRPIPNEFWNWGVANSGGRLREIDAKYAMLQLMPQKVATITREGIKCNGMYYSCDKALRENWFERAHLNKSWTIKASYDRRLNDVIYLIDEKGEPILCELLPRENKYKGHRLEDVEKHFNDKKLQRDMHDETHANVISDTQIEVVVNRSKKIKAELLLETPMNKTEQQKISSEARSLEKERNRKDELFDFREQRVNKSEMVSPPINEEKWKPVRSKEDDDLELLKKMRMR